MSNVIKLVQGDTRPALVATLTDQTTSNVIDLSGSTVVLKFRELNADTLTATVPGTLVDPQMGVCIFNWEEAPNALSGEPGTYEGEVEITFPDGTKQTVYDPLYFVLRAQF